MGWFAADGQLAANLSAFAMPLMVNGRTLNAAAFQSGAVRPAWRGRGLYRDLTQRGLAWCTDKPALCEPYGFHVLPMHAYSGPAPAPTASDRPTRMLNPSQPADLSVLQAALKRRMPVSETLPSWKTLRCSSSTPGSIPACG